MDRVLPEEVWVAGKGWSIDFYDWSKADYIIGINEAAIILPAQAALARDFVALDNYKKYLRPDVLVFLRKMTSDKYSFPNQILWEQNEIIKSFCVTITIGMEIFYYYGARKFHMVGFDSISGDFRRAPSVERLIKRGIVNKGDVSRYNIGNPVLKNVINNLPIEVLWEH